MNDIKVGDVIEIKNNRLTADGYWKVAAITPNDDGTWTYDLRPV